MRFVHYLVGCRLLPFLVVMVLFGHAVGWEVGSGCAQGCTTPVHRYAIYNWSVAPYWLFCLHEGASVPPEFESLQAKLIERNESSQRPNLKWRAVDLTDSRRWDHLPEEYRQLWQQRDDKEKPLYLLLDPRGLLVHHGPISDFELNSLIDSAARQELGRLMHEGNATVLVLIKGTDSQANQRAEAMMQSVIDQAASGKIVHAPLLSDASVPTTPVTEAPSDDSSGSVMSTSVEGPISVGRLSLSPDDPNERWLLRNLLSVEPDLKNLLGKPMVFAVYGRGRVLPPFVDKGINEENLLDGVRFLTSPCSCQIKEQNPGVDLLMDWDWEATADALTAEDETEVTQATGLQYIELTPGDLKESSERRAASGTSPDRLDRVVEEKNAPVEEAVSGKPESEPDQAGQAGAEDISSFTQAQIWRLGLGLGIAAMIVFFFGWRILRKARF